jgi:hypothetical protein
MARAILATRRLEAKDLQSSVSSIFTSTVVSSFTAPRRGGAGRDGGGGPVLGTKRGRGVGVTTRVCSLGNGCRGGMADGAGPKGDWAT